MTDFNDQTDIEVTDNRSRFGTLMRNFEIAAYITAAVAGGIAGHYIVNKTDISKKECHWLQKMVPEIKKIFD